MAADDRESGDSGEEQGRPVRELSPERAELKASVLAEMQSGRVGVKPKPAPKKTAAEPEPKPVIAKGNIRPKNAQLFDEDEILDVDGDDDDEGVIVDPDPEPPRKRAAAKLAPDGHDEDEDEEEEPEDEDAADDDDETPAAEETPEAKRKARALAGIAQAERRSKARIAEREAEFERKSAAFVREWEPLVAVAQRHKELEQRAERDPYGALEEFAEKVCKLSEDDWLPASKRLFERSPVAQKDPKTREESARAVRERELMRRLEEQDARLKAFESKQTEAEQQQNAVRQAEAYIARTVKAVTDDHPLVKRLMKASPNGTKRELHRLAVQLAEENEGRAVKPALVVARLEKRERRRLSALGVDLDALVGETDEGDEETPKKTTTTKKPAAKRQAANGDASETKPLTRNALLADVQRNLEKMRRPSA